jgi:hypothetical protein
MRNGIQVELKLLFFPLLFAFHKTVSCIFQARIALQAVEYRDGLEKRDSRDTLEFAISIPLTKKDGQAW